MSNDFDYEVEKAQAILEGEQWKLDQIELLQLIQSDETIRLTVRPRRSGKSYALAKMQQWWQYMGDNTIVVCPNTQMKYYFEKNFSKVNGKVRATTVRNLHSQYDKIFVDEWCVLQDSEIDKIQNCVKPGGVVYGLGTPYE